METRTRYTDFPLKFTLVLFLFILPGCLEPETYPYSIIEISEEDLGNNSIFEFLTGGWIDGVGNNMNPSLVIHNLTLDVEENVTEPTGVGGAWVRAVEYDEHQGNFIYGLYGETFNADIFTNTTVIRRFLYNISTHNLSLNLSYIFNKEIEQFPVDMVVDDFDSDGYPDIIVSQNRLGAVINSTITLLTINSSLDNFTIVDTISTSDFLMGWLGYADFANTGKKWLIMIGAGENTSLARFYSINDSLKIKEEYALNYTSPDLLGIPINFDYADLDDDNQLEIIVSGLYCTDVSCNEAKGAFQLIDWLGTTPYFKQFVRNLTVFENTPNASIYSDVDIEDVDGDGILDIIFGGAISNRSTTGLWKYWHKFDLANNQSVKPFLKTYGILSGYVVEDRYKWTWVENNTDNQTIFVLELADIDNDFRKEAVSGYGHMTTYKIVGRHVEGFKNPVIAGVNDYYWPFIYPANYTYNSLLVVNNSYVYISYANITHIIGDDNQTEFDSGTYTNTFWNTTGYIELTAGNVIGSYNNSITLPTASNITSIFWTENLPYREELRNNQTTAYLLGEINMSQNALLYHLNNDSFYGENDTHIFDFSYNGNNGTASNTIVDPRGFFNQTHNFSSVSSSYIEALHSTTLNISKNLTLAAWIYPLDVTGREGIISKIESVAGVKWSGNYGLVLNGDDLIFRIITGEGVSAAETVLNIINPNEWNHVAARYNRSNGELEVFHNGLSVGSTTITPIDINITNFPLRVGDTHYSGAYGNEFDGKIDEVAIWNKTLTDAEITSLYDRGILNLTVRVSVSNNSINWTNYTEPITKTPTPLAFTNVSYVRYNFTFERPASSDPSPRLQAVNFTIDVIYKNLKLNITTKNRFNYGYNLSNFITNEFVNNTAIRYALRQNNSSPWLYYSGSAWIESNRTFETASPAATINANILSFPSPGNLTVTAILYAPEPPFTPYLDYIYVIEQEFIPPIPPRIEIFKDLNHTISGLNSTFFENETIYWRINLTADPNSAQREWPDGHIISYVYCDNFGKQEVFVEWFTLPYNETGHWEMLYKGGIRTPYLSDNNCTLILDVYNRTLSDRFRTISNGSFRIRFDDAIWPALELVSITTNETRSWLGTNDNISYNVTLIEDNPKPNASYCNVTNPNGILVVNRTPLEYSFRNGSATGTYTLTCLAEDEKEHVTIRSWDFELFDSFCGPPIEYPRLRLYYPPYSRPNIAQTIYAFYTDSDDPIKCGNVTFNWNGSSYYMTYISSYQAYAISFTPEELGTEYFNISADSNGTAFIQGYGKMIVKNPFTIDIELWQRRADNYQKTLDKTKDTRFLDEWAYIYLYNGNMKCEPMHGKYVYNSDYKLGNFWDHETDLLGEGCYFHAPYQDGVATIEVWDEAQYEIWLIDKAIQFLNPFDKPLAIGEDINLLQPQNIYYEVGNKIEFIKMNSSGVHFTANWLDTVRGIDAWSKLAEAKINGSTGKLSYWVEDRDLNPFGWFWGKVLALIGPLFIMLLVFFMIYFMDMSVKQAISIGLAIGAIFGIFAVSIA